MDMNFDQYKMIKSVQILIRNDNLIEASTTNDEEKNGKKSVGSFKLFMHYPWQLLRTAAIYGEATVGTNFTLKGQRFTLKTMEVAKLLSLFFFFISSNYHF